MTAKRQQVVLKRWIEREREFMAEAELTETAALAVLTEAYEAAGAGVKMDANGVIEFGLKYYHATAEDLYGDTDSSDELEEELAATL